ncbi:MAG TPA: hypothetical protein DCE14_04415 [Kosmotogaceae bacterium]|nr:hypothetical protein [Kosmotogaceae bacterium]
MKSLKNSSSWKKRISLYKAAGDAAKRIEQGTLKKRSVKSIKRSLRPKPGLKQNHKNSGEANQEKIDMRSGSSLSGTFVSFSISLFR